MDKLEKDLEQLLDADTFYCTYMTYLLCRYTLSYLIKAVRTSEQKEELKV